MLVNWTTNTTRGNPIFVRDDDLLTIICLADDRGIWTAIADVLPGEQLLFTGEWNNGRVRLLWLDENEDEIFSILPEGGQTLKPPEDAAFARVNCIRTGDGTATFQSVNLVRPSAEVESFLPVPPPSTTQKHHITGWKWGRNIALMVHDEEELQAVSEPPTYIDENEDIIPYEVKGWQHGRRLDLEIGNMQFTDEEE